MTEAAKTMMIRGTETDEGRPQENNGSIDNSKRWKLGKVDKHDSVMIGIGAWLGKMKEKNCEGIGTRYTWENITKIGYTGYSP